MFWPNVIRAKKENEVGTGGGGGAGRRVRARHTEEVQRPQGSGPLK